MLRSVDLSDYMLRDPAIVLADDDIFSAIQVITANRISGACVVDGKGRLEGVLSEMDCLRAILSATYNQTKILGHVRDFMTAEVDVCELHADVVNVAEDMLKKGHRRRPVVKDGKLVGQITCRQLLKVVSTFS